MNTHRHKIDEAGPRLRVRDAVVPYFSQWESRDLVKPIIRRRATARDDVLWAQSGAPNLEEYADWAGHLCGIACLRMMLAAYGITPAPTYSLAMLAKEYGAYSETPYGIKGLIYKPFVELIEAEYGLVGRIFVNQSVDDLRDLQSNHDFVMASVHHTIRAPDCTPPDKGGHLVLLHDQTPHGEFVLHNPSGDTLESQENAVVQSGDFDKFFAGRGITIQLENKK